MSPNTYPLHGSRLIHGRENIWKTTWRSCGRFEWELGYLEKVHEYTSSSSGSSRKRLWHEFTLREELSLGLFGTISLWNKKTDQWTVRNPWSKNIRDTWLEIVEFEETSWKPTSLLCEKAYQITIAEMCMLSDWVLCVGEMGGGPNADWKNEIKWYSQNDHFKGLDRIDDMQTEFEWKIFPRFTTLGIFEEIQKLMKNIQCEPEHFDGRIIFVSMNNDIVWGENGNTERCIQNSN